MIMGIIIIQQSANGIGIDDHLLLLFGTVTMKIIKHFTVILIFIGGAAFGQQKVYEDVYREAMADSLVSSDEENLLYSLQLSLGLEEDEVLEIRRQVDVGPAVAASISRTGRRRLIANNMTYGNTLYGVGIPYVLGIDNISVIAGIQMLAFAGGLYFSLQYTKNMDLPVGRANFQIAGAGVGLASLYPLISLVGGERWFDFDPDFKIGTTYMMTAVPLGTIMADRLYRRWQPSDGQSLAVIGGSILGAGHGMISHLIATPDNPDIDEGWFRLNSLLVSGGFLGGGLAAWRLLDDKSITSGDAYFMGIGLTLGLVNYIELLPILEIEGHRAVLALLLLTVDTHLFGAYALGRPYDMTLGDAAIVSLGALAGNATFRGVTLILGVVQGSKGMLAMDIVTRLAGSYFVFRSLDLRRDGSALGNSKDAVQLSMAPKLLWQGKRPVPGLGVSLRF